MFLVVSRLDAHFGFERPIGGTSKIARPKNRAPRKKFVYPCVVSFEGLMTKRRHRIKLGYVELFVFYKLSSQRI